MLTAVLLLNFVCSAGAADEPARPDVWRHRVVAVVEAGKLALSGRTLEEAIDHLVEIRVAQGWQYVPGGRYDYLTIAGAPLILSYRKDGTPAGVAPTSYSLSDVLHPSAHRLLQGDWKAQGVQLGSRPFGVPTFEPVEYGILITDNLCIPSGPSGLAGAPVFYTASRRKGPVIFRPGYPQPEDQAVADGQPSFWTARRTCLPVGTTALLTFARTADGVEVSLWVKR